MPFRSKAQHRKCRAANDPNWDCSEWAHETPSMKKLPERKRKRGVRQVVKMDLNKARAALDSVIHKQPPEA